MTEADSKGRRANLCPASSDEVAEFVNENDEPKADHDERNVPNGLEDLDHGLSIVRKAGSRIPAGAR